jgi:dienelactone hydrolase
MNRHGGVTATVERLLPTHGGYDAQAAEDSWRRMLAFFERHLAAPAVDA